MNYMNILGLNPNYTLEDVKKSYKLLVKKYHPDINKDPNSEDMIKKINVSYEIAIKNIGKSNLQNNVPNKEYDQQSYSDTCNYSGPKNKDIHLEVVVDYEEIYSGTTKEVLYSVENKRTAKIKVVIPKSTQYNTTFVFKRKGYFENFLQPAGDVYVKIVEPKSNKSNTKSVNTYDLVIKHAITYLDILIGNVQNIRTVDGSYINLTLNDDFDISQTMKVDGKGLVKPDGSRGVLYINFLLEKPNISNKEKEALMYIRNHIK